MGKRIEVKVLVLWSDCPLKGDHKMDITAKWMQVQCLYNKQRGSFSLMTPQRLVRYSQRWTLQTLRDHGDDFAEYILDVGSQVIIITPKTLFFVSLL